MLKITTALALSLVMATPALAQAPPSPTKALVNVVVAEQFCRINMPQEIVVQIGEQAAMESGLDMPTLVDALYIAAFDIGNQYRADGTLMGFCLRMAEIYAGSGW